MGRVIGLLAMILGVSGLILALAGVIAVWRVEALVVDRCNRVASSVSNQLQRIDGRVRRLESKVKNLTIDAEAIRDSVTRLVARAVDSVVAPTELGQLRQRLLHLAVQSEQLGETLQLLAEIVEDISELTQQFDANSERTERLARIAESLNQADAALAQIRERLATLPEVNGTDEPQKLTELVEQCHKPLARVAEALDSVQAQLDAAHASLADVRQQLLNTIRMAAVLTSLFLGWFGLGQACLLRWGWNRIRMTIPRTAL